MSKKILTILILIGISVISVLNIKTYAFGPSNKTIYDGIDVSEWQGDIDKVKEAGIEIVYIRAGQGFKYEDSKFKRSYTQARKYNTNIKTLVDINKIKNPDLIYNGENLMIFYQLL